MIVDTSVVIAILLREPGFKDLVTVLQSVREVGIGTPTLAEASIVLASRSERDPRPILSRFMQEFHLVEVPFGEPHWREAASACLRFGKGRHPARLNFGDCLSYATARVADQPLLYVGEDFSRTDIEPAVQRM
jgi:ribonuclease VapC